MSPRISIITINYNDASGLEETVKSVASQSYAALEYIVVDGGSNDGSVSIIEKYVNSIDKWISEPDNGIYNAMNKGVQMATGEYLLFLNSGDYLRSTSVIEEVFLSMPNKEIVYGAIETMTGHKKDVKRYPEELTLEFLLNSSLPHPATFYKKELFAKYGLYDESLKIVADWAFNLKILSIHEVSYQRIDPVISVFKMDGISSKPEFRAQMKKEGMKVLNDLYPASLVKYLLELQDIKSKYKRIKQNKGVKLLRSLKLLND